MVLILKLRPYEVKICKTFEKEILHNTYAKKAFLLLWNAFLQIMLVTTSVNVCYRKYKGKNLLKNIGIILILVNITCVLNIDHIFLF